MKKSSIDFAPRSWRRALYQTRIWIWLMAIAGVVLCVTAAQTANTLFEQMEKQDALLLRTKVKLSERTESKPVPKKSNISDAQANAVNAAIAQLNLPWRDVFGAMEAATPKTIALLSLEPDAKRNMIKIMAEAKTSDDMIGYIEKLKKQDFFATVWLTKHEINEQDPNKPLRFQLEAQWMAEGNGDPTDAHAVEHNGEHGGDAP